MNSPWIKIGIIVLMLVAEALAIGSEVWAAKLYSQQQGLVRVLIKTAPIVIAGGFALILAYIWGYQVFQNIWIVAVLSITAILIMEPIIAYSIFKEMPTTGAIIGFILGILGFFSSIYIK